MLFTKEINHITYKDVVDFCGQQISESISLDYKKYFPADLEKTIAAFANTMGGLIIIGVEDSDSKPKLPVEGLIYERGLRERVNSIMLDNIYPPVFPEIQVCEPINNRTFVIIRIPQSNMTPHYIRHRTQIYIRTDDINKPEELAPAEQIECLRDRRKKSEELRETLYASALERYNNYLKLHKFSGIPFSEATVSIAPLYPSTPFKPPQAMRQIAKEIKVKGYRSEFPLFPDDRIRPVQEGITEFIFNESTHHVLFTELNHFGLFYHKQDLGLIERKEILEGEQKKLIENKKTYLYEIISLLDLFLESSAIFYEKLGYWGLLEFKFSLDKLLGIELIQIGEKPRLPWKQDNISVDDRLKWQREYYVNEIKKKRLELLIKLLQDIGWSLGWDYITEERIKEVLQANQRL